QRQQLDVREAHLDHVVGQWLGQLAVAERPVAIRLLAPPRADVNFVNGQGPSSQIGRRPRLEPTPIAPTEPRKVMNYRCVRRGNLGAERKWVRFEQRRAALPPNLKFVASSIADLGDEQLPDARSAQGAHR